MSESMVDHVAQVLLDEMERFGFDVHISGATVLARAAIEAMRELPHAARLRIWKLMEDNARVGNLRPGHIAGNGMPDAFMHIVIDAALSPSSGEEKQSAD